MRTLPFLLSLLLLATTAAPAKERLALRLFQIPLPGAPASVLSADLNRDGITDLVIVVAYTEWDQITTSESAEMDQIEGLVEMMTIVPALADRRELHVWLGDEENRFVRLAAVPLDLSVLTLAAGPPGEPVVALTDDGIAGLRIDEDSGRVRFEPLFEAPSVLSGTRVLLPDLGLVQDIDGDGIVDVMVPRLHGVALHLGSGEGVAPRATATVPLPPTWQFQRTAGKRQYPLPRVEDVDGDRLPDLIFRHPTRGWSRFWVARSEGDGVFSSLVAPLGEGKHWLSGRWHFYAGDSADRKDSFGEESYFGDLDGDGLAEFVTVQEMSDEDAGWRKEMKQAKRPPVRVHVFPARADLTRAAEPSSSFPALGYAFGGEDEEIPLPGGFQDLDGDGRKDLVTITLDFSLLQAFRILATRSISIGLDFHIWCQQETGSFVPIEGLDLSGKIKLRLDDLRLGQLSQFAGDFDGDGRFDFVQMGRGKKVTIHRGRAGCRYPSTPDLTLKLVEEPANLALVRVADFDGDGLSDLMFVQPQSREAAKGKMKSDGASLPVRLDLYLSRAAGK